jgi:hypothetical protein
MPNPSEPRQLSTRGGSPLAAIPAAAAATAAPPQQRTTSLRGEREGSRKGGAGAGAGAGAGGGGGQSAGASAQAGRQVSEPQYTVYIRLPFDRNGFVDPPRVTSHRPTRERGAPPYEARVFVCACSNNVITLPKNRWIGMRRKSGISGRCSRETTGTRI